MHVASAPPIWDDCLCGGLCVARYSRPAGRRAWIRLYAPDLLWNEEPRYSKKQERRKGIADGTDDGAGDEGLAWAARVRHPNWKNRSKALDPHEHRFLGRVGARHRREFRLELSEARRKRFESSPARPGRQHLSLASEKGRRAEPFRIFTLDGVRLRDRRLRDEKLPTAKGWPRFSSNLLTPEGREKWRLDWWLDRVVRDPSRTEEEEAPIAREQGDLDKRGWAPRIGVRKASRILSLKLARERAEANVERYLNRNVSPTAAALAALDRHVRRTIARPIDWHTMTKAQIQVAKPRHLVVSLARRQPKAYAVLAAIDAEGATKIPPGVITAIEREMERLGRGAGPDFAAILHRELRGEPGDGQRMIETAAALSVGVRPETLRKVQRREKRAVTSRHF
jgi:hypothetical protein